MLDEEQAAMMAEECILVDRDDRPTGSASKVCNVYDEKIPRKFTTPILRVAEEPQAHQLLFLPSQ